jgi:ABC-type transport system involved in resistance to organic solvents, permease component
MSATLFEEDPTAAPTGYWIFGRLLRAIGRITMSVFGHFGERVLFQREFFRALLQPKTYLPLTIGQMRQIGVDSVPLVATVSAFIGAVTAYQTTYQLFPGVQFSVVGWITRQSIVLELGPLLTALVLAGRIGAKMTAEIGTMRVTEQIDALETLAYDPVAYLMVPRVIAG